MPATVLTFTIRHVPRLKEWTLGANDLLPFTMRFWDTASGLSGAPGLIGVIRFCFWKAGGLPAVLVLEADGERFSFQFQSEAQGGHGFTAPGGPSLRPPPDESH
jgi:hypothetical protein